MPSESPSISLNKFLSSKGLCSRREADAWIDDGRVRINGDVARKGNRVRPGDRVELDGMLVQGKVDLKGQALKQGTPPAYIMLHKPPGITCTTDRRDPSNVIDFLKFEQRVFPVGRLDKYSTGLLLLTNDGDIVNKILRREHQHEKEYVVWVDKPVTPIFLERMSQPIPMLDTHTQPCTVRQVDRFTINIVLTQGLNRQIRRMCAYCGYDVRSLKRVRLMHLELGTLKKGTWRMLKPAERNRLLQDTGTMGHKKGR